MAYSREIETIECVRCNGRPATREVYTNAGKFVACYCDPHAAEVVGQLDRGIER